MTGNETNKKPRWCWRSHLAEFRGLRARERAGFLLVLEWFDHFRRRHELAAGCEAARAFGRGEVLGEARQPFALASWTSKAVISAFFPHFLPGR